MFSEGPSFFALFFVMVELWIWSQNVVDLSLSLTMSAPAETTWKLSMSRLDFLILVSQGPTVLIWKFFYQVLFSLGLTVYKGNIQLMVSGTWCPTGFFWKVENNVFVHIIVLSVQNVFRLKAMFSKSPSFFVLLFVIMGLWICACTW